MKKTTTLFTTLLFIIAVVLSNQTKAQSSCAWAKKAGGSYEDGGTGVATDASGNVYAIGYYYSSTIVFGSTTLHNLYGNGPYMYLAKYDSCGTLQWAKQAGGNGGTNPTGIATDATGNVYVTGYFTADTINFGAFKTPNSSFHNAFLVKYNSSGIAQWAKQGTGNQVNEANAISVDASNNIYITGGFASTAINFGSNSATNGTNDGSTRDAFVAKFDNNGNNLWVRGSVSNSTTSGNVNAYSIGTDAAGNAYVAGNFESTHIRFGTDSLINNGYYDIFLVKYDVNGNEMWLRSAGSADDEGAYGTAVDATGNAYITGHIGTNATVSFGTHSITNTANAVTPFIAKFDANGNDLWAQKIQSDAFSYNSAYGISLDANSNPYIIGTYNSDSLNAGRVTLFNTWFTNASSGNPTYDIFVAKYKSNGILSWARTAGGDSLDQGNAITTGPHGALYITGEYNSPTISFAGIALTSTNSYGDVFIANNISTLQITPNICLVSDDSIGVSGTDQYNVVYWDKTSYTTTNRFIVYRETTSGVYQPIGSRSYASLSEFTDTARHVGSTTGNGGDPNGSTYRYKIQIEDTSGTYSYMSPYHNTVYFVSNGSGTFTWNIYAVENTTITPVSTFSLSRDNNSNGSWGLVQTTAGTQTTLNDPNYSTYQATASWRVDGGDFNCNPTLRLANNHNGTDVARVKSHSNQNNNRMNAIKLLSSANQINIYPNPNKGNFTIETTATEKQTVQVFDVNGKLVFSQAINGNINVDASNLVDGVYNVSIIGNEGVVNKRLVIVK
ncbi:MAG: T9SS type A sorting domain-containing protein [Bacteroidia bacterium]